MNRKWRGYLVLLFGLLIGLTIYTPAYAKTLLKKGSIQIKSGKDYTIDIRSKEKALLSNEIVLDFNANCTSGGIRVKLAGEDGKTHQNDYWTLKGYKKGDDEANCLYNDDKIILPGKYIYTITNTTNITLKVSYRIYAYTKVATAATVSKSISLEKGEWKKLSYKAIPSGSYLSSEIKTITRSNKKIADFSYTEADGIIWIYGKKAGHCNIILTMYNGKKYTTKITVTKPKPYLKWNSYEIDSGKSFKNYLINASGKIKWSSTNKKIATVSKKGRVKAKKIGTCYIIAKYKGKKYKCRVKVCRVWPNFGAYYTDYDTRGNYFTVIFRNWGSRTITICSKGAYSIDVDYKTFDRKLRLKKNKNVKIRPGQRKAVKFYVKGRTTWPKWEDHTIRFYIKYAGIKYLTSAWDEDCGFRIGKKWYDTYWDEDKFENYDPY